MYFDSYGPSLGDTIANANGILALGSTLILVFVYITTKWRVDLKGSNMLIIYEILILWVVICYFRAFLNIYRSYTMKEMLFSPYVGLSLFPDLLFYCRDKPEIFFHVQQDFVLLLSCHLCFLPAIYELF